MSFCSAFVLVLLGLTSVLSLGVEYIPNFVETNNDFGLKLYDCIRREKHNLLVSPIGVLSVLSMLLAGSSGKTSQELYRNIGYGKHDLPLDKVHTTYGLVNRRTVGSYGQWNDVYFDNDLPVYHRYYTTLKQNYSAYIATIDFTSQPERIRDRVNERISSHVRGQLQQYLKKLPDSSNRMLLYSSVFSAVTWKCRDLHESPTETFYLLDGTEKEVPVFKSGSEGCKVNHTYSSVLDADVFQLQANKSMDVIFFVPRQRGTLDKLEKNLNYDSFREILKGLSEKTVRVQIPYFKFGYQLSLLHALECLEMNTVLGESPDFSLISDELKGVKVADFPSNMYIDIDHNKTITSGTLELAVRKPRQVPLAAGEMILDHPFIFGVRHAELGLVLSYGRMVDPKGSPS